MRNIVWSAIGSKPMCVQESGVWEPVSQFAEVYRTDPNTKGAALVATLRIEYHGGPKCWRPQFELSDLVCSVGDRTNTAADARQAAWVMFLSFARNIAEAVKEIEP